MEKENRQPRGIAVFAIRQMTATFESEKPAVVSTHHAEYLPIRRMIKIGFAGTLPRDNFLHAGRFRFPYTL